MTPVQYQKAKLKLGLSHPKLAALLGIDRRTSQRYALGEDKVPKCIGIVLKLLAQGKLKPEEIAP